MNDYLLSAVLGAIEGLTEFLPISSTAHLRIAEWLLHISLSESYWKMYTIVIQLGAILCLPVYFRKRIAKLVSTFPRGQRGERTIFTHPLSLTFAAFVVTAVPAWLLAKVADKNLESLRIFGWSLLVGGVVMWAVDALNAKSENAGLWMLLHGAGQHAPVGDPQVSGRIHTWTIETMSLGQSIWIGACQVLSAVFPGTSRSMSTIAAGQLAGMSRSSALEFSFFLAMPTMVAATAYDLAKVLLTDSVNFDEVVYIGTHECVMLAIGFAVSFLVAYGTVAWFMAWVRERGFVPFAIYRIVVGTAVLIAAAKLAA